MEEFNLEETIKRLEELSTQIIELYNQIHLNILTNEDIEDLLPLLKELIDFEEDIINNIPKEELIRCLNTINEMEEILASPPLEEDEIIEEEYENPEDFELDFDFDVERLTESSPAEENAEYKYQDNLTILQRISRKINQKINIDNNNCIYARALFYPYSSPVNSKLCINDANEALISLETIQTLRERISYSAPYPSELSSTYNENDTKFINELDELFKDYKIRCIKEYSTLELLFLYQNTNIEDTSNNTINILKQVASNHFNANFEIIVRTTTRDLIAGLSTITNIENRPEDVFDYMEKLTKLDILLEFTDKNLFIAQEEYLNNTTFKNDAIKKRIISIFNSHKGKGRTKEPTYNPNKD